MSDALTKLQNVKVEPSLKKFQNGAVGSINMLSLGFVGIIDAFKDEMEKCRGIEEQIEKSVEDVANLQNEMNLCHEKCANLQHKLREEMKKIQTIISQQSIEVDNKLNKMADTVNEKCDIVKQECLGAVETISNKVGKSLENVDKLQEDFENLEQETNDQIRSLSSRIIENKELIEEQDNKFKDQLNELTEILHNKALELDTKIDNCLNETTDKINAFDEKQQKFQFDTNQELAQKADIEDLRRKLDINKYEQFIETVYNSWTQKINGNIESIQANVDQQSNKQNEINDTIASIQTAQSGFKTLIDERFNELQSMINNPIDVDSIKQEITEKIFDDQANFKQEMISLIQESANSGGMGQAPAFGTRSGNCIACGRGPSSFQPLPVNSPSPSKKPKHGGGFNRINRRKSTDVRRKLLNTCGSASKLDNDATNVITSITSPKSAKRRKSTSYLADSSAKRSARKQNKTVIQNDPVRVKIPDINDD